MKKPERFNVLNAQVDDVNMREAIDMVSEMAKDHCRVHNVVSVNANKSFQMESNKELRDFVKNADLLIPDGSGIILGARILWGVKLPRVSGVDLTQNLCQVSGERELNLFFFGAKEDVNAEAVRRLRERFPDIRIVGRRNGYFKPDETPAIIEQINSSKADLLFLALGSPKQEKWVQDNSDLLNVSVCMGCGGTLDVISGRSKRAPVFFQKVHLEWFYRAMGHPSKWKGSLRLFSFGALIVWTRIMMIFGKVKLEKYVK